MDIDWILTTEFLVEIFCKHFYVSRFVHDLGGRIQLGIVPRDGLCDFCCANERTLLAMQKLGQRPVASLDTKIEPFFVAPLGNRGIGIAGRIETSARDGLVCCDCSFNVNRLFPVEICFRVPLSGLGLFV